MGLANDAVLGDFVLAAQLPLLARAHSLPQALLIRRSARACQARINTVPQAGSLADKCKNKSAEN